MRWLTKKRIQTVTIFLVVAFCISQLLLLIFEKEFSQTEWENKPTERYQMVDDIIESQLFIGKSETEIVNLLGQPVLVLNNPKRQLVYNLGKAPSFFDAAQSKLVITFENEKVVKVTENKNQLTKFPIH